jgi:hypothetical protein
MRAWTVSVDDVAVVLVTADVFDDVVAAGDSADVAVVSSGDDEMLDVAVVVDVGVGIGDAVVVAAVVGDAVVNVARIDVAVDVAVDVAGGDAGCSIADAAKGGDAGCMPSPSTSTPASPAASASSIRLGAVLKPKPSSEFCDGADKSCKGRESWPPASRAARSFRARSGSSARVVLGGGNSLSNSSTTARFST